MWNQRHVLGDVLQCVRSCQFELVFTPLGPCNNDESPCNSCLEGWHLLGSKNGASAIQAFAGKPALRVRLCGCASVHAHLIARCICACLCVSARLCIRVSGATATALGGGCPKESRQAVLLTRF